MIVVGMPSAPAVIPAASLVLKRKSIWEVWLVELQKHKRC
jgi:hypothetical protein